MNALRKDRPWTAKIVPWEEIGKFYVDLVLKGLKLQSMVNLIKHIQNSDLKNRLHAYTSVHKLVVTIYDPAETNREALHIELNPKTMRWHFEYFPKPYEPSEMIRYCDEDELINRFDKYVEWLKW
jgi:hypothetical protein